MILVTTPTGNIGSKVLAGLLETREHVRVLARHPEKLSMDVRSKVEIVQGSLDSPESVREALRGADQLFLIIPPSHQYEDVNDYYLRFSNVVCDAIKKEDVKRVVYISGTGLGFEKKAGPVSASFLVEEMLQVTGVNLRILHCGTFMENLFPSMMLIKMTAQFGTPVPADVKIPWVATRDIAEVAVHVLTDKEWRGQGSVGVLGPKDMSYGEIAQILSEVLKKEVSYKEVPADAFKANLLKFGASEAAAEGLIDIFASMTKGVFNRLERRPQTSSPTTYREWCEAVFKPALDQISPASLEGH